MELSEKVPWHAACIRGLSEVLVETLSENTVRSSPHARAKEVDDVTAFGRLLVGFLNLKSVPTRGFEVAESVWGRKC